MTPKQPRVTAAQVIAVLVKAGFVLSRQTGSHRIFKNAGGKRVTVPFHAGTVLHPKVLKSILLDAGLTIEEFAWFLNS